MYRGHRASARRRSSSESSDTSSVSGVSFYSSDSFSRERHSPRHSGHGQHSRRPRSAPRHRSPGYGPRKGGGYAAGYPDYTSPDGDYHRHHDRDPYPDHYGTHHSQHLPDSHHSNQYGSHRSQHLPDSHHSNQYGGNHSQHLPDSEHSNQYGGHHSQHLPDFDYSNQHGNHHSQQHLPDSYHSNQHGAHHDTYGGPHYSQNRPGSPQHGRSPYDHEGMQGRPSQGPPMPGYGGSHLPAGPYNPNPHHYQQDASTRHSNRSWLPPTTSILPPTTLNPYGNDNDLELMHSTVGSRTNYTSRSVPPSIRTNSSNAVAHGQLPLNFQRNECRMHPSEFVLGTKAWGRPLSVKKEDPKDKKAAPKPKKYVAVPAWYERWPFAKLPPCKEKGCNLCHPAAH